MGFREKRKFSGMDIEYCDNKRSRGQEDVENLRRTESTNSAWFNWTAATPRDSLTKITQALTAELKKAVADDKIHLCGQSPLATLATRPADVLQLAQQKLYTWQYDIVPIQWRRLYEDACLHLAAQELSKITSPDMITDNQDCERCFSKSIMYLDKAIFIVGGPGRKGLIETAFKQLEEFLAQSGEEFPSRDMNVQKPDSLQTDYPISRHERPMLLGSFETHLKTYGGPAIIPGTLEDWPATILWGDMRYLLKRTLGGRRTVPVEIGASYTDDSWTQEVMPFNDFIEKFLIPDPPEAIGYLAQHDLLSQIPKLRNDIMIPDFCWTSPPRPRGAAAKTFGLTNTPPLDEPLLHAWLGPKGTKTPLHTDAYHNILCQVVGHKYVRLYPPEERVKLYPQGVDERGVQMGNTSGIDVKFISSKGKGGQLDAATTREMDDKFPMFKETKYQEAVLGAGECLYIPLGWWHYVESLTNSFSVSFWWN